MNMSVTVTFESERKSKLDNNSSLEQKNISKGANENLIKDEEKACLKRWKTRLPKARENAAA